MRPSHNSGIKSELGPSYEVLLLITLRVTGLAISFSSLRLKVAASTESEYTPTIYVWINSMRGTPMGASRSKKTFWQVLATRYTCAHITRRRGSEEVRRDEML